MPAYAFLLYPSGNRVYHESAAALSISELGVFNEAFFAGRLQEIQERELGGVRYISFSADTLSEQERRHLANLSALYTLYELTDEGLLRPLVCEKLDRFDDDLLTILKYRGKTNELFTKLLVNVTAASSAFASEFLTRQFHLLDPLSGRGTTLNQALMYGWDCAGLDVDKKDVEAYGQFLATYLKNKRFKHKIHKQTIQRKKEVLGWRFDAELGLTKEAYKAGELLRASAIHADTRTAATFFKAHTFDLLVADLPYGVRHGSHSREDDISRRPEDLLAAALPVWVPLLKPGGALGFGWNRHVAGRDKMVELLTEAGLEVCDSEPYRGFRHFVDQSIQRDILVACKPEVVP